MAVLQMMKHLLVQHCRLNISKLALGAGSTYEYVVMQYCTILSDCAGSNCDSISFYAISQVILLISARKKLEYWLLVM